VVYSRLTTFAGLAALIGTRAYPLVIPLTGTLPAVAYQTISSEPKTSHDGFSGLTQTRVQLTAVAADYATAKEVEQQLRAAFNAVSFTALADTTQPGIEVQGAFIDNSQDDYDDANGIIQPAARIDVILWHTATP
jgi:hypothetical protein